MPATCAPGAHSARELLIVVQRECHTSAVACIFHWRKLGATSWPLARPHSKHGKSEGSSGLLISRGGVGDGRRGDEPWWVGIRARPRKGPGGHLRNSRPNSPPTLIRREFIRGNGVSGVLKELAGSRSHTENTTRVYRTSHLKPSSNSTETTAVSALPRRGHALSWL